METGTREFSHYGGGGFHHRRPDSYRSPYLYVDTYRQIVCGMLGDRMDPDKKRMVARITSLPPRYNPVGLVVSVMALDDDRKLSMEHFKKIVSLWCGGGDSAIAQSIAQDNNLRLKPTDILRYAHWWEKNQIVS